LVCFPTSILSLCASPHLCSVLAAPLGGWLLAPPLVSERGSVLHPQLCFWCYITVCYSCCSVLLRRGFSLPGGCTGLCWQGWRVGCWVGESCMVHDACLCVLQIHSSSFKTCWQGEMVWHREAFHKVGIWDVTEFDSD
jgi:hypothetical protein